jgi:pyruvate,water dikinase
MSISTSSAYTIPFAKLGRHDVETVGGKNSSLGEMISHLASAGVTVPDGFATTAQAYRDFLQHEGLAARISKELATLDVEDVEKLTTVGARIRQWILATPFPPRLEREILESFERMSGGREIAVAVRSSATAEDLPDASFAGQQETFLNVRGRDALLKCVHEVFASLFNDRAIAYRVHQGFAHDQVALSAGIQYMVRSDLGSSGVMFTLDTDSGFRNVVFITASYGLGETVVQGAVNPDEFYVYKSALRSGHAPILRRTLGAKAIKMVYGAPGAAARVTTVDVAPEDRRRFSITDLDIVELAKQALIIEEHYGCPMDIEWGKDGETGKIYILRSASA